jgi:hypothetical protein
MNERAGPTAEPADGAEGAADDEPEEEGDPWDILAAEFGENLLPDTADDDAGGEAASEPEPVAGDDQPS